MAEQKKCSDVIELGPAVSEGVHLYRRHRTDQPIQEGVGKLTPLSKRADGKPFQANEVLLRPREDGRFDVESVLEASPNPTPDDSSGPAKVTSNAYRNGWDAIFGKTVVGAA